MSKSDLSNVNSVLILGGNGLVGFQVARTIAKRMVEIKKSDKLRKIVISELTKSKAKEAIEKLDKEFNFLENGSPKEDSDKLRFETEHGDVFIREEIALNKETGNERTQDEIKKNPFYLDRIFKDTFGIIDEDISIDEIQKSSLLIKIIERHNPEIIIDCINTATSISYQDVQKSSKNVFNFLKKLETLLSGEEGTLESVKELTEELVDKDVNNLQMLRFLLVSQEIPRIASHVGMLYNQLKDSQTKMYIKIGTTGTGGMGLNIPYTHSEEKPSFTLLSKSSVAFAHTGLLFLMARTPDAPIIKEIKPAAMIGYKKIEERAIIDKKTKSEIKLQTAISEKVNMGGDLKLKKECDLLRENISVVGIDTGENGFFSLGEFEAITALDQMEYVTPEEIARYVVAEIEGRITGKDVIGAIDSSVLDPSYRAGYLRETAIKKITEYEDSNKTEQSYIPSVAVGQLGPPRLTKLLFEAFLFQIKYKTIKQVIDIYISNGVNNIVKELQTYVDTDKVFKNYATSIGIPILCSDAETIYRGSEIKIPEPDSPSSKVMKVKNEKVLNKWVEQGWVDLREDNVIRWIRWFQKMVESKEKFKKEGSSEHSIETYIYKEIRIGEVVAWIFNNEDGGNRH